MKANGAPEKIYLEKVYPDNGILPNGLNYNQSQNDIEYTRTDAFIEKVKDFFEDYFTEEDCKIGSAEWVEVKTDFDSIDSLIRAFENHIK